jgi:hypothetical protein
VHAVAQGGACPAHAKGGFSGAALGSISAAALIVGAFIALGLPLAAARLVRWRLARKRNAVQVSFSCSVRHGIHACMHADRPSSCTCRVPTARTRCPAAAAARPTTTTLPTQAGSCAATCGGPPRLFRWRTCWASQRKKRRGAAMQEQRSSSRPALGIPLRVERLIR